MEVGEAMMEKTRAPVSWLYITRRLTDP